MYKRILVPTLATAAVLVAFHSAFQLRSTLTTVTAASLAIVVVKQLVIGAAFGKIVTAVVADFVMPLVTLVMPSGDWRNSGWVRSCSRNSRAAFGSSDRSRLTPAMSAACSSSGSRP